MTTATATPKQDGPDLDAIEEDARRRIGELTEARQRMAPEALTDKSVAAELRGVESELAEAERALEQAALVRGEVERRQIEAREQAEEKQCELAQKRADRLEPEVPKSEAKIDAAMQTLAQVLAQHNELLGRLSAELRTAGTHRGGLTLRSSDVEAALAFHLAAAGQRGVIDLPPLTGGARPLAPGEK